MTDTPGSEEISADAALPRDVGTSSGTLGTFGSSGLAGKGQWITVGATRTFTFTGTHFDIWYNKLNEASMTYQVDGGAVDDVPIQNATVAVSTTQVGPLTGGEHTAVISNKGYNVPGIHVLQRFPHRWLPPVGTLNAGQMPSR